MKNVIKFFYNIDVDRINKRGDKYYLESRNEIYLLENIFDDSIYSKYSIISNYPLFHRIMRNVNNDIVTLVNNRRYILLRLNNDNRIINMDILERPYILYIDYDLVGRTIKLWSDRVDYTEYLFSQVDSSLAKYFSYYNGLTENGIQLLRYVSKVNIYIEHYRVGSKSTMVDYYNPLNVVFDSKVRDISEYLKDRFFKKEDIYDDAIKVLGYFNNDEVIYYMARLLYPSYYYDLVDNNGSIDIDDIERYEVFIKKIYKYIRSKYSIVEIEWLEQ